MKRKIWVIYYYSDLNIIQIGRCRHNGNEYDHTRHTHKATQRYWSKIRNALCCFDNDAIMGTTIGSITIFVRKEYC